MKFEVWIAGKLRVVDLEHNSVGWCVMLDGQPVDADIVEIAPHTLSILLNGQSHTLSVTPTPDGKVKLETGAREFTAEVIDPRVWRGRRHGSVEAEGRQKIVAPMPGKVVRVLVLPGERVETGQGLLVVEAMKMQNEIRSPKSGVVERVLAQEGQAVNAGEILAWVE